MKRHQGILAALTILAVATPLFAQKKPEFERPPEPVGSDWRLRWESVPGAIYRLERSIDLKTWKAVELVQADKTSTALVDKGASGNKQVYWRVAWVGDRGSLKTKLLAPFERLPGNQWRISWTSEDGLNYTLERSFDLENWEEVETVDAVSTLTSLVDDAIAQGEKRVFWRVQLNGVTNPGEELILSDIEITSQRIGDEATVTYAVLAGGEGTVDGVVFFNGEVALGDAQRGPGDLWTLTLPWDPTEFSPQSIEAVATASSGETASSTPTSVLIADPSRFIPLAPDGSPQFGKFLPLQSDGSVTRFVFYPEGQAAAGETSGVHFEFEPGTRIESTGDSDQIVFSTALYFNGHSDDAPDPISGPDLRLEVNSITANAIANLSPNLAPPLPLRWGSSEVEWNEGTLGPGGWSAITVRPPIGNFLLPPEQTTGLVTRDSQAGEDVLVVCFHGEWRPSGNDSPIFRIPQSDPLKIYLYRSGRIEAQGSAEAEFGNGGTVHGQFSWREPVFEFSFSGQAITIPALGTLRSVLPSNPADCLSGATTDQELDAAAECLKAFRSAYKGLTLGALAQDGTSTNSVLPTAGPEDAALAALEAWAARARSWESDRNGQSLAEAQARELIAVANAAAKASAAGSDLTAALRTVRLLLELSEFFPLMASTSGVAASELDPALENAGAAFERIATETPRVSVDATLPLLGGEISKLGPRPSTPDPQKGQRPPPPIDPIELRTKIYDALGALSAKFDAGKWSRYEISDVTIGDPNPFLNDPDITDDDVFEFFDCNVRLFRFWHELGLAETIPEVPRFEANIPLHMDVVGSLELLRDRIKFAHKRRILENNSVEHYLERIEERRLLLEIYNQLEVLPGSGIFESSLEPATADLIFLLEGALQSEFGPRNFEPSVQRRLIRRINDSVLTLAGLSTSPETAKYIDTKWKQLTLVNNFIPDAPGQSFEDFACLRLETELGAGGAVESLNPGDEGSQGIRVSGRYDATLGDTLYSLQLNQAGRYLVGWLTEYRRTNASSLPIRETAIEGLLSEDLGPLGSLGARYVIRAIGSRLPPRPGDKPPEVLILTPDPERPDLELLIPPLNGGAPIDFEFISPRPRWPDQVLDSLPARSADLVAANRFPLHEAQATTLAERTIRAMDLLEEHLTSISIFDKLRAAVEELNGYPADVHPEQRNVARNFMIEGFARLSFANPTELPSEIRNLDPWEVLRALVAEENPGSRTATAYNTFTAGLPQESLTPSTFQYVLEGSIIAGDAFIVGGGRFDFTVTKRLLGPDGVPGEPPVQARHFRAFLGGLSISAGVPGGGGGFQLIGTTTSRVNYDLQNDFNDARVVFFSAGVTLSPGVGRNWSPYAKITLEGADRTAKFDISGLSDALALSGSAGIDYWLTAPVIGGASSTPLDPDLVPPPLVNPIMFQGGADVRAGQPVHFATNESEVTRCGRQLLREFLAQYRAFIDDPFTKIQIHGYADSTGSPLVNDNISQARADSTMSAVLQIVNNAIPADQVDAAGLGEDLAAAQAGIDPLDEPGVPDPDFRRADVILNGLFSAQLFSSAINKNQ